ncbi:protein downstream neighbor of son homolog [Elysia marginata]|uniref:Protein downstream neighbor of son homolog n=1 Tax=Elysia marginata TaxID=1093978 RepID=A0AAV4GV75_9GAST|nr:protein downstream neighbor of son homolog [Elysia marginata]
MPSPGKQVWQNPKDVMKTHRIKRQSSTLKKRQAGSGSTSKTGLQKGIHKPEAACEDNAQKSLVASGSLKRKNPFACQTTSPIESGVKRRSILDSQISFSNTTESHTKSPDTGELEDTNLSTFDGSPSHSSNLIGVLTKAERMSEEKQCFDRLNNSSVDQEKSLSLRNAQPSQHAREKETCSSGEKQNVQTASATSEENLVTNKHQPTDWSLKTKLRVVVESREETFNRIPGVDAKNALNFVHHTLESGKDWKDLNIFQKLRRCCLHYSYPQFPWMRKFPRISGEFRSKPMSFLSNNDEVLKDIQSDWTNVFTSLYQQLRGGICPYFYTCTHQFTVLFRCQRFSSKEASMSALLSPSTRGFRELLTKEGYYHTNCA